MEESIEKKSFWRSRVLWLNFLAALAMFAQNQWGFAFSPELQAFILLVLNAALRFDTDTAIGA